MLIASVVVLALAGCGSHRTVAAVDAGPAEAPIARPTKLTATPFTGVTSPLDEEVVAGPERFAGIALPRDFQVVSRTGTRVVLEGLRGFAPLRRYLEASLSTPPLTTTRASIYYQYALPRGARPDAQHVHVLAHTLSGTRVRLDITVVETSANAAGTPIEERLRKAGWGPNLRPPQSQNE